MTIEIGLLCTVLGAILALAGWLGNRDKKIANDSEWKGVVNTKLDLAIGIRKDFDALSKKHDEDVSALDERIREHGKEIAAVKESAKSAHKRLDDIEHEMHK